MTLACSSVLEAEVTRSSVLKECQIKAMRKVVRSPNWVKRNREPKEMGGKRV